MLLFWLLLRDHYRDDQKKVRPPSWAMSGGAEKSSTDGHSRSAKTMVVRSAFGSPALRGLTWAQSEDNRRLQLANER